MTQDSKLRSRSYAKTVFSRNACRTVLSLLLMILFAFIAEVVAAPCRCEAQAHYTTKHIYSETADPRADIAAAMQQARTGHKRVLLDFGGDWCGDCQVLDIYFHQAPNDALLSANYVLVHVWIGHIDKNLDIPEKYGVAIKKGVPALAVLDDHGKTIFAQKTGEFEDMRNMDAKSVTDFLEKWKIGTKPHAGS